jgi:HEAT repeat protein
MRRRAVAAIVATLVAGLAYERVAAGQAPSAGSGQAPSAGSGQAPSTGSGQAQRPVITNAQLEAAIDQLGQFDLTIRTNAAATVRRAFVDAAASALTTAAKEHKDEYVRYRALVLLSGFGTPGVPDTMKSLMADRDDRVRTVAYEWLERHPDPSQAPALIAALDRENSEFVRPALTRALAALPADDRVRAAVVPLVMRGPDAFRGAVIVALGEHKAAYAAEAIAGVAKFDGPLQDDSIIALGEIGDRAQLPVLSALQKDAPAERHPAIAAAVCLMGLDCAQQQTYLVTTVTFAVKQPEQSALLGSSAHSLGVLGAHGRLDAIDALITAGVPAQDPARGTVALALADAALRNPDALVETIAKLSDPAPAITLLRDGFDMLSAEDFAQEQFFVAIRQAYWAAPDGSPRRRVTQALIDTLEF